VGEEEEDAVALGTYALFKFVDFACGEIIGRGADVELVNGMITNLYIQHNLYIMNDAS
jgi:hypothetical protein